jgi:cytochrome bd-type quinol oxidase subunit 2
VHPLGDTLRARIIELARPLSWALFAVIIAVSLWTPLAHRGIARRWFSLPTLVWFSPVPILVLLAFWRLQQSVRGEPQAAPFVLTGDLPPVGLRSFPPERCSMHLAPLVLCWISP